MTFNHIANLTDEHRYWRLMARISRRNYAPHERRRIDLPDPCFHPKYIPAFIRDLGLPPGEKGDWRLPLPDGSGLHVQENYNGSFSVHWDRVDPTQSVNARIRHGAQDAPITFMLLSTTVGVLIGCLIDGKKGALVGAGLGLGLGAASVHAIR